MKNCSRVASPPAAYAKYLDDFEECEEAQASPALSRTTDQRNLYNCNRGSDSEVCFHFSFFEKERIL